MENSTKKWLNLDEAAEYLELSKSRIYELTGNRKINFYQPGGKRIF